MKICEFFIVSILAVTPWLPVSATILTYDADLSGLDENPPSASSGTGEAFLTIDNIAQTIKIDVVFDGLTSFDTSAFIHCCVASPGNGGVATVPPVFPGFPLGVTSGTFDATFSLLDAAFYNPTFITNNGGTVASAEAVLLAGLAGGEAYFNIHTQQFPGGEIRGFIATCGGTTGNPCGATTTVPEPAMLALLGLGLAGLGFSRRRKPT
jgi:hypothetical protein